MPEADSDRSIAAAPGGAPGVTGGDAVARLGLGLAALGRPAYITTHRDADLGDPAHRTVEWMRAHAHELLDAAWAAGIRYLDAARSYGLAEEFLGSWLAAHPERRAELTVGSKWGYAYVGDWQMDAAVHERKEHSRAQLDRQWPETLDALGGAPDVYLVHSVTPDSPALDDAALLDGLRAIAADGVRVGFSTSGPEQAAVIDRALTLADSPFSVVQSTWNLLEPSAGGALAAAHDAGWLVVVKESLANGRLAPGSAPAPLDRAAGELGMSADALAIGAVLAQPWADVVLLGAVTAEQLAANTAARAVPEAPADLAALAQPAAEYWADRSALAWR
ncbi:aldo/keto reductase [Schumannella sp. 10F1B-5-1]|uniref:aldo/keto reductase n=1 Tax=Schumannella sp. 10F1B-5-1 TaxID=2590780 RepID=UPI0011311353|nr:aldo/keto reductase [Schumannella sp. 10F1B-5-1]TPW71075.1 aldo/keto reductase [Schumannella sp. 10F1B-5-1]